jgi:hypothetical protein
MKFVFSIGFAVLGAGACAVNTSAQSKPMPASIAEGVINGGGGAGIRCGERVELLDLYEARVSGRKMIGNPQSRSEAVDLATLVMSRHFWNPDTIARDEFRKFLASHLVEPILDGGRIETGEGVYEDVRFVDALPISSDLGDHQTLPRDCELEQIAFYSDESRELKVSQSAWDGMDWLSRSMLVVHELTYVVFRREGMEKLYPGHPSRLSGSMPVRYFIGDLFAGTLPSYSDGMNGKNPSHVCSGNFEAYMYAFDGSPGGELNFVFNSIRGSNDLYQLRARFPGITMARLLDEKSEFDHRVGFDRTGSLESLPLQLKLFKKVGEKAQLQLSYVSADRNVWSTPIGPVEELSCYPFEKHEAK